MQRIFCKLHKHLSIVLIDFSDKEIIPVTGWLKSVSVVLYIKTFFQCLF